MRKIKKFAIALSAVACLSLGTVATTQLSASAEAETPAYTADSLEMLQAASIRKDSANHGIRFATVIGNNKFAEIAADDELTTLIMPENVLIAAGKTAADLKADATFKVGDVVVEPVKLTYNGDASTLKVDEEKFPNCKLFCAVLNLAELQLDPAVYLNSNIVAHSYVKKADGTVQEIGTANRAPALVAANALDANETDASGTLDTYVAELEINDFAAETNYVQGDAATLAATTNVEGVKVSYDVEWPLELNGNEITAVKYGDATVTASIAGGKITATQKVSVVNNAVARSAEGVAPEGNLTFNAYNVTGVKFNDTDLEASEYTYENNVVTVSASALYAKTTEEVNTITLVSETSGNATVVVKFMDTYSVDFTEGDYKALVGNNVAGNTYFYGSTQFLDGDIYYTWNLGSELTSGPFYFSNTTGNWLDKVRADDTVESISFDVKAGDEGKTPTVAKFAWSGYDVNSVAGENGWVTFTVPRAKLTNDEYWIEIWYNAEKTENPTCLYFDNFRVNYKAPVDPYLADFEDGHEYWVMANNDDGINYGSYDLATIDGNQCLKWTNKKTDAATLYFTDKTDNWLSKVRADDTVEAIHFDVKAGDAGKTPTVAYFCQWKEPRYYAIAEAGEDGWVTFTIPRTYLKDMSNANEYWMRLCYDEDAANVNRNNMTDIPTVLYFDNFRVSYVQA